jgi:histidine ammonia-lyase
MIVNTAHILGIELLAAAQGIEFLRPLKSSAALEEAHGVLRNVCVSIATDRYMAPEIERATLLVRNGALSKVFRSLPNLPALWIPV